MVTINNPYNAYSIELYIGEKRSGKTLSMVAQTYEDLKKHPDVKVFCNFHLNKVYFPTFELITLEDLQEYYLKQNEFENAIFLIDEVHLFMDSRQFGKKGNQQISYFIGQMGKRGNVFRGTTHFPRLVDFRLRCYCEKYNYIKKYLWKNGEYKQLMNYNSILSKEENEQLRILITPIIRKLVDFTFENLQEPTIPIIAHKYFNMYDTKELIFIKNDKNKIDS